MSNDRENRYSCQMSHEGCGNTNASLVKHGYVCSDVLISVNLSTITISKIAYSATNMMHIFDSTQ